MKRIIILLILVFLIFSGAACVKERKKEQIKNEKAKKEEKTISPNTQEAEVLREPTGPGAEEDIFRIVYPNSVQISSDKSDKFEEKTYRVKESEAGRILDYYDSKLTDQGFKLVFAQEDSLNFEKEREKVDVNISETKDEEIEFRVIHWFSP